MSTSTLRLYSPGYSEARTYLMAAMFIAGNIIVPQLCHLVPHGGIIWLPIYFFTLVGSYKYGWKVGLLTALASPVLNSALCGMPAVSALPAILLKSVVLAFVAGLCASRFRRATLWQLTAVVLGYQIVGTAGEWLLSGSLYEALQDFRIGIPGMAVQAVGGWYVINRLMRR
ncbi:MAG: ECF transporter S component [Bacteroides sp.]|nr:ECF transporter S component [Bacteroides sp.]MCM1095702.1 hypothetical protein [Terasakiella sp.]